MKVVTFGEPLVMFYANEQGDLSAVDKWSKSLAGAETNVAIGLSRLGHKTGLVTKLGEDSFAKYIFGKLKDESVDVSRVTFTPDFHTGMYLKEKVSRGNPAIEYYRKISAATTMSVNEIDAEYYLSSRLLHMTTIFPALSNSCLDYAKYIVTLMKGANKIISYDPNLRKSLWNHNEMIKTVNEFARYADYFFPGREEGQILSGYSDLEDIAKFYLDKGVKTVVVTEADGAYYHSSDGQKGFVPGFDVEVVDTVGAGDAFVVGFISAVLEGKNNHEAVVRGNAIGARNIMFSGDNDGLPNKKELEKFLENAVQKDLTNNLISNS